MPIKLTTEIAAKTINYDTIICIASYIITGSVMSNLLDITMSYIGSFLTLTSIAIFVFYIKKWLAKKDAEINKNGGFISFIKALVKKECKDNCIK